ncbi:hypothetical protein [Streptomyces sp. JHA26]|uniref:hypothetical protein n=1 Tax=Streptomyces sp. JHA26 TaxID=1917143 RepID=UPI00098BA9BB|nr:hypothetical protein [Streptomyces sp. JHA26]
MQSAPGVLEGGGDLAHRLRPALIVGMGLLTWLLSGGPGHPARGARLSAWRSTDQVAIGCSLVDDRPDGPTDLAVVTA